LDVGEAERHRGDDAEFRVDGLDPAVGQLVEQGVEDLLRVGADACAEVDELWDAAAGRP
jgi:hypothetical protein